MTPRAPDDQFARKRASAQPSEAPGKKQGSTPRVITPLVSVRAENWPPEGLSKKERAKLQAQIVRDFEKTLEGSGEPCGPMRLMAREAGPAGDGADGDAAAAKSTGSGRPVDCRMTSWGYEIIEIDGVTVRARVEYWECTDGTSFRKEYPL